MKTSGRGSAAARRSIAAPARQRALGAERGRVVVGRLRPVAAAMVGRQPPPPPVEVDQDLRGRRRRGRAARRRSRSPTRSRRRARPTGRRGGRRSADAASARDRAHGRPRAAGQSPRNTTSSSSRTPVSPLDRGRHVVDEAADVGGGALPVVDDEVRVLLGDRRAAAGPALPADRIDQPPGRVARRVAERRAGGRDAERLVLPPPAPDLVEPAGDDRRVRGREAERRREDDLVAACFRRLSR